MLVWECRRKNYWDKTTLTKVEPHCNDRYYVLCSYDLTTLLWSLLGQLLDEHYCAAVKEPLCNIVTSYRVGAIVFIWVWWNNIVMVVIWVWGTNSESGFCEDLMVWLRQGLTTEPNSPSNPIGDHWRFLKSIETDFYHIGWNEEITIWNCAQNKSFLRHSYSPCCGWLWCEGLYVMLAAGPGSIIGNIPNWRYNAWWTI